MKSLKKKNHDQASLLQHIPLHPPPIIFFKLFIFFNVIKIKIDKAKNKVEDQLKFD